jgi:ABC-type Mn2+/Zn2+ transport system ATPase subunit
MTELASSSGLALGYGARIALRDVSFEIHRGERIGVLGPNGGGKTTFFRGLARTLPPRAGTLDLYARCATVPQTDRSRLDYPVSALDVVLMGTLATTPWWRPPNRAARRAALDALETVGLADLASETFGELSGGQRQRVLVARALVSHADLLLLDEPYSGLDAPSAERLTELIDRLAHDGRGVMIATHDVEQTRRWDRVLCLNGRQIAFGPPDQTLTLPVLEATYGEAIVPLPGGAERGIVPAHHHHHEHEHAH